MHQTFRPSAKNLLRALPLILNLIIGVVAAGETLLGAPDFKPSPERPVGWRGDWTGRFPGATPPTVWSRRVAGITKELRYQAAKPAGDVPGKDARPLEYFTIKDWLVAGPYAVSDPVKDLDKDFLGGEATVMPADGAKAGDAVWKYLRADVDTQSRHDHNGGIVGHLNVDFVFAFGKLAAKGMGVTVTEGDFVNKAAYAHTYIHAPVASTVRLRIPFSGTAARFWLNGKQGELAKGGEKFVDVPLLQGWNRLLIKVNTANGVSPGDAGGNNAWRSLWLVTAYLEPIPPFSYESQNISWMTKLTGRSMSQPIVVGDRIFVGSNISDLICFNKHDGKVLWLRASTPYDGLSAEERAAIPEMKEKIEPLLAQFNKESDEVVAAINAGVSPLGLPGAKEAELDKKLKTRRETQQKIEKAFSAVDKRKFAPYSGNEVASSNAAPCSDGARVYWACGGGIKGPGSYAIVCFDLEGKRIWTKHEALGSEEHGCHQSPALVDGKLIYGANHNVMALDAKTGNELWRNAKTDTLGSGNSPVIARIGNEPVIVTIKKVLRVSDGHEICPSNVNVWGDPTPVVENGVIYNTSRFKGWESPVGIITVKLPASTAENSKSQILWDPPGQEVSTPLRGPSYSVASPLLIDNIMYGVDMIGGLIAVDVQAKKSLYRQWLSGYNRYNRFLYGISASPALAGKTIYLTDDAGYTHLIQPGPEYKELGRNILENIYTSGVGGNPCRQESFYTAPYFDGKAMYLKGEEYLYCIEDKKGK